MNRTLADVLAGAPEPIDIQMDDDGYPTEEALDAIEAWKPGDDNDCRPIFEAMRRVWRWHTYFPEGATSVDAFGRNVTEYEVHTGGWSGHESMLSSLEDNAIVWIMTWEQVRRGGHYIFRAVHP